MLAVNEVFRANHPRGRAKHGPARGVPAPSWMQPFLRVVRHSLLVGLEQARCAS